MSPSVPPDSDGWPPGSLQAASRKPTNLSKVNLLRQEPNESLAAFLERLMEAFRQYTPMDPQADESRAAILASLC